MIRMGLALWVLLAIAAGAFQIRRAGADDVKVFVLPPGGPATQPHEMPKLAGPSKLTERPPQMPLTDDRVIDSALLRDLRLAPDQIAKLSPILKEAAQEFEAASQGYKTKYQALRDNYENRKAAAAMGGRAGSTQPDIQEMRDRTQAWEEYQKQKAQLRERVIARIAPVLTEEQRARFTDAVEDLEERPETANRRAARTLIGQVAQYMELTEAQRRQAMELLLPEIERFQAQSAEIVEPLKTAVKRFYTPRAERKPEDERDILELRVKHALLVQAQVKAAGEKVERVFSAEQKQEVAQKFLRREQEGIGAMLDWVARSLEPAGLSDEQKAKTGELTAAAREAMFKIGPADWMARYELFTQLRRDVFGLLTDEQKNKLRKGGPECPFMPWLLAKPAGEQKKPG